MADHFVVRTHRNCEFRAKRSLEARGFNVYVPLVALNRPLFASYLFVRDDGRGIEDIKTAYGIDQVVMISGEPLRASMVETIRRREIEGFVRLDRLPITFSGLLKSADGFDLLFRPMRGAMRALAFVAWLIKHRPVELRAAA